MSDIAAVRKCTEGFMKRVFLDSVCGWKLFLMTRQVAIAFQQDLHQLFSRCDF